MITLTLVLLIWLALNFLFVGFRLFSAYVIDRAEEARWQRLHPDMPSWRRPA